MNAPKPTDQLQRMQSRIDRELAGIRIEGDAGGGMVTVAMNGARQLTELNIDPAVVNRGDIETLEQLVLAAAADAHRKTECAVAEKLGVTISLETMRAFDA